MDDLRDAHTEDEGREPSVSSWSQDNDDGNAFDDNMSQVGSDYSEFHASEAYDHPYAMPSNRYAAQEMKYNPSEMMFGPSSSSTMQYNYNFSQVPAAPYHRHMPPAPGHLPPDRPEGCMRQPDELASQRYPANYNSNAHPSQSYMHQNMWYPNASVNSYRSYGSHPYARQYGSQFSHDHMMDMFQMSNSGREARNRAEKNRRDKLNGSIQELSTMVPHVAESPRRVDKTAVLRFAAHGLRLQYVFGKSLNNRSVQTTDTLMKLLDSFFITLTCNGQIVLVSSSIEHHLGHCQADLYGQNILHITHPEDHQMLKQKLIPADIDSLFDIQPGEECSEPRQRTEEEEYEIDRRLNEDKRSFTVRLARSGPRSEATTYELVRIDGSFRRSDMAPRGLKTSTFPSTLQLMRRSRGREDILPMHTISGNDIVLIAIARIIRPPVINRAMEVNRLEYRTRHLIDGRIIDCDQRISLVAGYMTDEIRNLSPFTFIHQDDVRWVIVALRQMYDCNSSYGESTYRLFTGNGKIIYLHTKGFLEIDKNTNKVHSFICVNTLLDEEEGKRLVQNMKNKFSVIIDKKIPQALEDVPASENPQQLEKAVLCLIQNLHHSPSDDSDFEMPHASSSHATPNMYQLPRARTTSPQVSNGRSSKSPPLALVPPAADTIKNSITKSVGVVKAGKFLRAHSSSNWCGDMGDADNPLSGDHQAASMKRKLSHSASEQEDEEDYRVPMQRRDIENVLSNSLQQLDNRLNQQIHTAIELRDHGQLYDLPHTEERFVEFMNEHRKQREMYMDITTEFESQRECPTDVTSSSDNELAVEGELPLPDASCYKQSNTESEAQSLTDSDESGQDD